MREFISRIAAENQTWGAPRIRGWGEVLIPYGHPNILKHSSLAHSLAGQSHLNLDDERVSQFAVKTPPKRAL